MSDVNQPTTPGEKKLSDQKKARPSDVRKELKALHPPFSDGDREQFLQRLFGSSLSNSQCLILAVDYLCGRDRAKLTPFMEKILNHLAGDQDVEFRLESLSSPDEVKDWVWHAFAEAAPSSEQSKPMESSLQYWILYQIFRCRGVGSKFAAGLQAFKQGVDAMHAEGKRANGSFNGTYSSADSVRAVNSLMRRIPGSFSSAKQFVDELELLLTFAGLADEVGRELSQTLKRLGSVESENHNLQESLEELNADHEKLIQEASQLRKDLENQVTGARDLEGSLTTAQALRQHEIEMAVQAQRSRIVDSARPLLENMRLYLDRPQPNKDGAISQLAKIEAMLKQL